MMSGYPHRVFRITPAVALMLCTACSDRQTGGNPVDAGGTVVIATTSDPDILFPPLSTTMAGRQVNELVFDYLAQVGPEMNTVEDAGFRPRLAESWSWSADSLALAFRINPRARWHDGAPVTAADVSFTYEVYTNPRLASPIASSLEEIDSVTVRDSLTAVFWFSRRSSHQLLDATQIMILPRHVFQSVAVDSLREFAARRTPVGSGRFRFGRWSHGSSLELRADTTNYRGSPKVSRIIWTVAPDPGTAVTRLLGGDADVYGALRRENLPDVAARRDIRVVTVPSTDYVFMRFNLRDPRNRRRPHSLFAARDLRRALTMAVDREALVRNVFDSLARVPIGPTIRSFPTTDPGLAQLPYDPVRGQALLDSLGWRRKSPGSNRARNGRGLAFTILVPSSSSARMKMAVLLQEQLRRVGADVGIEPIESSAFQAREKARDFDVELGNWHLGATPSLKEAWTGSAARAKDGFNFGYYENPLFDAYVDSATGARNLQTSRRYYSQAYEIIIQDAPAVWLYEPLTVLGIHRRLVVGEMRPDAWWYDLSNWFIPDSARIGRDTI